MNKILEDPIYSKKYVLSPGYKFIHKKRWDKIIAEKIAPQDSIGILQIRKSKIFVFNVVIGAILKLFKKPHIGSNVINKFVLSTALNNKNSFKKIDALFRDLIDKKLIVEFIPYKPKPKASKYNYPYYKRGTQLNKFKIGEKLNSHEQLHVYSATDIKDKKYIIKSFQRHKTISEPVQQYLSDALYREITILSFFAESKYINKIKSYKKENNYAVLEYFEGKSIKHLVDTKVPGINLKVCLHLITQIVEAIKFIHSKNYIHGDIHDKNILFDKKFNIQIIDFGLSMHIKEEAIEHIRKGGIHVFLPPERIKNDIFSTIQKNPNYCSDIYQFGVIVYIILYRKYPFVAHTWKQKTQMILDNKIKFDSKCYTSEIIPKEIIQFIKFCMFKDPKKRIQDGKQLEKEWKNVIKQIKT